MSGATMIKLQSSDQVEISVGKLYILSLLAEKSWCQASHYWTNLYAVEREVAERSILIKNMMEDIGDQAISEAIPIPNVSCPSLSHEPMRLELIQLFRLTRQCSTRLSNGALITVLTPQHPPMTTQTLARRQPTLMNGIRSSCRLIKKCFSRSS